MKHNLAEVFKNFQILGDFVSAEPYGSGHINDTYLVNVDQGGTAVKYIFQRINHNVFKKPVELMENISRVTSHTSKKMLEAGLDQVSRRTLTVIKSIDNLDYHLDSDGNYWRAYIFIEKAQTYDVLTNMDQAYQAAKSFGNFQKMLVDLSGPQLHDTIPDFHNGKKRYQAFLDALEKDEFDRAKDAKAEIDWLKNHASLFDVLPALVEKGEIPVRITHNDTKINNIMLDDETGEGICVIDLDTVMPGLALFDFGDIVRTTASPSAEDEKDLTKVGMKMDRMEAVLRGYLASAGEFLNDQEKAHLIHSGMLITTVIGTRFLTDYLVGDTYFKVHREGHNLDRCRTQFKLVDSIEQNEAQLNELLENILNGK